MSQLFTRADAVKFIKKAPSGTRFCLHVRNDAPIEGEPDRVFPGAMSGYVNLSRADAARLVGDFFSDTLEQRGARVPINVNRYESVVRITYWIG